MNKKGRWFVMLGALLAAASVLPMVGVWRQQALEEKPSPGSVAAPVGSTRVGSASEIVVDLRDDMTDAEIDAFDARYQIDLDANSPEAEDENLMVADVPAGVDEGGLLARLNSDPDVEAAEPEITVRIPEADGQTEAQSASTKTEPHVDEPEAAGKDGFTPNDPRYSEQWNMKMIGAPRAWQRSRGRNVIVAVIDTGVAGKTSKRGKRAKDFNRTNFVTGYDFIHNDRDPYDDMGHGTHVAGTIAESTNNHEGVAGLAFEAKIMPLKVLNDMGFGKSSDIADAIRFATDKGAKVINMSLGSSSPSTVIHNACKYAAKKGVVIVCAAGNGFREGVGYPAAHKECIAVSAVGPSGELAVYSSYGKEVALAAPGGDMFSSGRLEDGILQNSIISPEWGGTGDDYYHFNGTSMASPHVAAAAALLLEQGVRGPERVRELLKSTARPKEPKLKYGAGILDADKATAQVNRESWLVWVKRIVLFILSLLLGFAVRGNFGFRMGLIGALLLGAFGPELMASVFAIDSPWSLVGFSALIPFLLFWEFERGRASQLVGGLSLGVALCLGWAFATSLQSSDALPWSSYAFGASASTFTAVNALFALLLAGIAWVRGTAPAETD